MTDWYWGVLVPQFGRWFLSVLLKYCNHKATNVTKDEWLGWAGCLACAGCDGASRLLALLCWTAGGGASRVAARCGIIKFLAKGFAGGLVSTDA